MLLPFTVTTPNSRRLEALQDGFKNVVTRALEMTQWATPRLFILAVAVDLLWHSLCERGMGFEGMIRGACE